MIKFSHIFLNPLDHNNLRLHKYTFSTMSICVFALTFSTLVKTCQKNMVDSKHLKYHVSKLYQDLLVKDFLGKKSVPLLINILIKFKHFLFKM